jgi:carbamoyl-phosphate synthase/aspartate carbamoyltransferase
MVGYPESLTDPSYEGQILVLTFPLIGNYGVPSRELVDSLTQLPTYFESNRIHISALVVAQYSPDFSHFLASSSLADWLKENNIPAIYGVDTRALTKKIRTEGSMLGKIRFPKNPTSLELNLDELEDVEWVDPNARNLAAEVSLKEPKLYQPEPSKALKKADGSTIRILGVDVGMKYNQIRCFVNRGVEFKVVPWNYNFVEEEYDGLFISNGPGDPASLDATIANIKEVLEKKKSPIFGICLGHQLLALASGAKTTKLKFGNRGHNIPCTDLFSGRCHITSQNHGFAVDAATLPEDFQEYFVNANDGTNEGIIHKSLPYFSVQFHPESTPGPRDAEYLFDIFIQSVVDFRKSGELSALTSVQSQINNVRPEKLKGKLSKVLILGSGGLSIGQAGEFDYSGSQAIKALKEENIYTVLINPNIATIQTSKGLADKVYFLPVTPDFVRKVIQYEKPDGIYVTFGGQTALNVGIKLKDEFESLGVRVLGTPIDTIITTEDRELFAQAMDEINEKCAQSFAATNVTEALEAVSTIGYPVIVRAAYALGGLGSGFADNEEQLLDLCAKAFAASPQILVEKSMKGWKEVEYEVVRDCMDNCITVCNMENFDPLGIHTGDSIVIAPSQTLSDEDYNMLRTTAVNVVRHLGVVGECNIQYALNPFSKQYCIIEVNARLSRSSALASKATGYPLAFVAAKLGLNIPLNEIQNSVTKKTIACFEPSLDYVVCKIPRWDLKKFTRVSKKISSSMKSVGEVMSIGRTFEETIQKAIRAIDISFTGFADNDFVENIDEELRQPTDQRLFAIAHAMHIGYSVDKIWEMTKIDKWFLNRLAGIVAFEKSLKQFTSLTIPTHAMRTAKQLGFSDRQVAKVYGTSELAIRQKRLEQGVVPCVKQIDTVAAEFPAYTNYLYLTYNAFENDVDFNDKGVIVLGSGVYRIGSSVEFDWCAVRAIRTLREKNVKTVMINYNPETVSTDYDEADRLYFENITLERVLDIYQIENSRGVILSMGGQTPNNISLPLLRQQVNIFGTSPEMIDSAENRYKFSRLLDKIGVDQPLWKELTSVEEATVFCDRVGFPVLVRPSYVLSGAAMNVVHSRDDLSNYLGQAAAVSREFPVVITKYIEDAKEIEMDAVGQNGKLVMHVVSEHVENAGVHSGDATLVLPPQDLDPETVKKIEVATEKICDALNVTGPFNIQFIAKNNEIKVIECNLRAARSFPFVSKVTGVDLIEMATKAMLGFPFDPYPKSAENTNIVGVKVPQFSFSRLSGADPILGVEMASTGEVACFGPDKYSAYLKALISTGFSIPKKNILLSLGSYKDKIEFLPSIKKLAEIGYNLFATSGTADFIQEHNIPVKYLEILEDENDEQKSEYSLNSHLANNLIDLYINLPSRNRFRRPASYMSRGYKTRRMAVDFSIPLITNIKCAKLFIEAISRYNDFEIQQGDSISSYQSLRLPGLINIQSYVPGLLESDDAFPKIAKASVAGGFTTLSIIPSTESGHIKSRGDLNKVLTQCRSNALTNYTVSLIATPENAGDLANLSNDVAAISIRFDKKSAFKTGEVDSIFKAIPSHTPIFTNAKGSNLASILLLGNLNNRSLHVTNVSTKEDIELISMSKSNGMKVSCDVAIHNLFLVNDNDKLQGLTSSPEDVKALWEHIDDIDCFAVGKLPHQLTAQFKGEATAYEAISEALPLLLAAVDQGKLSVEDIVDKLYTRPAEILNIPEQPDTYVDVEIGRGRPQKAEAKSILSPWLKEAPRAFVQRVVFQGQVIYVDGRFVGEELKGRDLSSHAHFVSQKAIKETPSKAPVAPISTTFEVPPTTGRRQSIKADSVVVPRVATKEAVETVPATTEIARQQKAISVPELSNAHILDASSPFYRHHILSSNQFTRDQLHILFGVAQEMGIMVKRHGSINLLQGRVLCNLFYEPSTRTSSSFEAAMIRLGGQVITTNATTSSVVKGETLSDTVRTLNQYGDVIVLRHPQPGSVQEAAKHSSLPVINAGDGIGEHPTQAFLDIYTIREELGTVNGLTITLVGDLKNGRTVHSLVKLLSMYHVTLNYVSPDSLKMPESIKTEVAKNGITQNEYTSLDQVIGSTDVLYVTRIQKERFNTVEAYEAVKGAYVVNSSVLLKAKPHMIVMHPLPRVDEIDPEVDFDQRAAYFRQMRYGLYIRMALLALVVGKSF